MLFLYYLSILHAIEGLVSLIHQSLMCSGDFGRMCYIIRILVISAGYYS